MNNEPITEVEEAKYLGVLIDKNLSWKPHIQNVNTKISKSIGFLNKVRHFAPQSILRNIYNAFILPNILYGLLNWGSASKTALDPLHKKLKKAVRLITFKNKSKHSKPLFECLNILNLEDHYKLECAKFIFNMNKGIAEIPFSKLFKKAKDTHNYKTRYATSGKFSKSSYKTKFGKTFIKMLV